MSRHTEVLPPNVTHPYRMPMQALPGFNPVSAFESSTPGEVPEFGNLIKTTVRPSGDFSLAVHPYQNYELSLEQHGECVRARMPHTLDPFILVGESYTRTEFDVLRTVTTRLHDHRKLVAEIPSERTLSVTTDISCLPNAKEQVVSRVIPPGYDNMRISLSGLARILKMHPLDYGALYLTAYEQVRKFWGHSQIGSFVAATHMPRLGAIFDGGAEA